MSSNESYRDKQASTEDGRGGKPKAIRFNGLDRVLAEVKMVDWGE